MMLETVQPLWCRIQHRQVDDFMAATVANHKCLEKKVDKLMKVVYITSGTLATLLVLLELLKPVIAKAMGAE